MKVLFIVGTCLSKNTSANMSHNSYIRGLVENGCEVDVVMAKDSWGETDEVLKKIEGVNYIEFKSNSIADRIRATFRRNTTNVPSTTSDVDSLEATVKNTSRFSLRDIIKKIFFTIFPQDKIYPLDKVWLENAKSFKSCDRYDLVISNSSPAASHKLAKILIENGNIETDRWIQIWEDPWSHDIYGKHSPRIEQEEKELLDSATEVFYVSPITTEYQKRFFPDAALKMSTIALPFFDFEENNITPRSSEITFGYFGDYYSHTRNLKPFFNVLDKSGRKGFVYGDTDLSLKSESVDIHSRVTLDVLKEIQNKTMVLVHLSNLYGGQIPGKIYHYSATRKPILFILDGTPKEQDILHGYFSGFNRYYFCNNSEESIAEAIDRIEKDLAIKEEKPVLQFSPRKVVENFLNK